MPFTDDADGDQGTRQIPIRFRVAGNQFTTPLISLFVMSNYWLCYVYFEKNFTFESSYSASWGPITVGEFCNYIALLFYMSIVTDPN